MATKPEKRTSGGLDCGVLALAGEGFGASACAAMGSRVCSKSRTDLGV